MTEQDPTPDPYTREQIRTTKRTVEDALIARPGVVGVDIGEKWSDGSPTGRQAIVVHVERKRAAGTCPTASASPARSTASPPTSSSTACGSCPTLEPTPASKRVRPLAGGISIGPAAPVTIPSTARPSCGRSTARSACWCTSGTPARRSA